jgi:hypothetical protein
MPNLTLQGFLFTALQEYRRLENRTVNYEVSLLKITVVFWISAPCSAFNLFRRRKHDLHLQGDSPEFGPGGCSGYWDDENVCVYHHHNHHHNLISVMELGHLLTRSGLTYPEFSSKVCHNSFCQLGNSVSLPWVIYYEAFYLHVASSFSCMPVICPEMVLFLIPL